MCGVFVRSTTKTFPSTSPHLREIHPGCMFFALLHAPRLQVRRFMLLHTANARDTSGCRSSRGSCSMSHDRFLLIRISGTVSDMTTSVDSSAKNSIMRLCCLQRPCLPGCRLTSPKMNVLSCISSGGHTPLNRPLARLTNQ